MYITDKTQIITRFGKNQSTYNSQAVIQKKIAIKLARLLNSFHNSSFDRIFEIGCGTGFLTKEIVKKFHVNEYILNDIVSSSFPEVMNLIEGIQTGNISFLSGDAEQIFYPENTDAIISSSVIQWFTNMEAFSNKIFNSLKPGGLIALSSFGKNNFQEIKSILNIGLRYKTIEEISELFCENFDILYLSEWQEKQHFNCPVEVLKHMKYTGVNSIGSSYFGKEKLADFIKKYYLLFTEGKHEVGLTYHPILLIGRKKNTAV